MSSITKISNLLDGVKQILSHEKKIEQLKGEKFNVFTILKIERKENNTHSAFLGELLNSKGSHFKGETFLRFFLHSLGLQSHLDIASTKVFLEYDIGPRNDEAKTGGRIDIIVKDKYENCICIENKINATDQPTQIERYCNYNKTRNKVIYLTLDGREPSFESKGCLSAGIDFFLLSYKEGISNWLEQCMKEAVDTPIVRETIKQYLILIRKMTSTTENENEKALLRLLISNYEEASYIAGNFLKAQQTIAEGVRQEVFEKLKKQLSPELEIGIGEPIHNKYAQLWIWFKEYPKSDLYFGIETFNGHGNENGNLYIGVFNQDAKTNKYTVQMNDPNPKYWYKIKLIEFEGAKINFGNGSLIMEIQRNEEFKKKLVNTIVMTANAYLDENKFDLLPYLNNRV